MPGLPAPKSEKALSLTQEEAFALLEMCTLTLANESPEQLLVLSRLGSLCREMLTVPPRNEPISLEDRPPVLSYSRPGELLTISCLY